MTRSAATLAVLLVLKCMVLAQNRAQLSVGPSRLDVVFAETPPAPLRALVLAWIATSARAVATYHARFPVARVEIRVRLREGRGRAVTFDDTAPLAPIRAAITLRAATAAKP